MDYRKSVKKKKCLLYLIHAFLIDNGYGKSAEFLQSEADLSHEYVVCDNICLETIFIDFELYYYQRFRMYPQVYKKKVFHKIESHSNKPIQNRKIFKDRTDSKNDQNSLNLFVMNSRKGQDLDKMTPTLVRDDEDIDDKICTGPKNFKAQIKQASRTVNTNMTWSDVKGSEEIKEILKEAIIYPLKYPNLFTQLIEPWRSILMYGPPGTGKTMLAKTLANESNATFFNVSCSLIVSKWRGDSEKLIKALFESAQNETPSIIFIDEIDAIASKRCVQNHEASRRMKSELFSEMDELMNSRTNVIVLATTNIPWDLDEGILRRFEKHIFVSLPDFQTRSSLLKSFLPSVISLNPLIELELNYSDLAKNTEYFSCNDIKNICKEMKMNLIRDILSQLETRDKKDLLPKKHLITIEKFKTALLKYKPILKDTENDYLKWRTQNS